MTSPWRGGTCSSPWLLCRAAAEMTALALTDAGSREVAGTWLPSGSTNQTGWPGAALTQALAALFTAGALTDLTPFRAGPRRGGQLRRSGKPGPFGNLTG